MQVQWYTFFFCALARRLKPTGRQTKIVAVALPAALATALVVTPPVSRAQVQGGILAGVQAILGVIQGLIQTTLVTINDVRSAMSNLEQLVVWPQPLIHRTQAQSQAMIVQYRPPMTAILHTSLKSASLPASQVLESVLRDHQVNNFAALTVSYTNTYGPAPAATEATSTDRAMADMDDAVALDTLKLLKASDDAVEREVAAANSVEDAVSQAAPGSAPFLTAAAIVSSINSQAVTQRMLAAELRQEATQLAHRNTILKEHANSTTRLRGVLVNLLQHQ